MGGIGERTRGGEHPQPDPHTVKTMLGTKRDWLCNAIVALVIVLGLGLVLTKSQYKQPDRLTVAEWTERTLNEIFHK
jgi:hypothetical protein